METALEEVMFALVGRRCPSNGGVLAVRGDYVEALFASMQGMRKEESDGIWGGQ